MYFNMQNSPSLKEAFDLFNFWSIITILINGQSLIFRLPPFRRNDIKSKSEKTAKSAAWRDIQPLLTTEYF